MERFLADENFIGPSIRLLRDAGHDVTWIRADAPGAVNVDVLALARREDRVLLTFDRDYGDLIYHRGLSPPPGVVYFRFEPVTADEPAMRLQSLLADPDFVLRGNFTIVGEDRTRQRPLDPTKP